MFQCHSRSPLGAFRPLKSPRFRRQLTLLQPLPLHPSFPAIISPLFIATHPSSSVFSPSLHHPHSPVFLPSFSISLMLFATPYFLSLFPRTLRSLHSFVIFPPASHLPFNTGSAIYKLTNCTQVCHSGRQTGRMKEKEVCKLLLFFSFLW